MRYKNIWKVCVLFEINYNLFNCVVILEDATNDLELLIKSLKIREKILYKHHKGFEEVYYRLYSYYVELGKSISVFAYVA